jgi:hypothetical protein
MGTFYIDPAEEPTYNGAAPISEAEAMRRLLDGLPIYATKIGFRTDSTPEERLLAEKIFKVHTTWAEIREADHVEGN